MPPTSNRDLLIKLGAAAGAITAILTLVFVLWPQLKPEPPSKRQIVNIRIFSVERNITWSTYLFRNSKPDSGFSKAALQFPGNLVSYEVELEGFKGQTCRLEWHNYDPDKNARIAPSLLLAAYSDVMFYKHEITPQAEFHKEIGEIWVPNPSERSIFFVRIELYDSKGTRRARADTERFPRFTAP